MKKILLIIVMALCLAVASVPKDARAEVATGTIGTTCIVASEIAMGPLILTTVVTTVVFYATWKTLDKLFSD